MTKQLPPKKSYMLSSVVTDDIGQQIEALMKQTGASRSELVCQIIEAFLKGGSVSVRLIELKMPLDAQKDQ